MIPNKQVAYHLIPLLRLNQSQHSTKTKSKNMAVSSNPGQKSQKLELLWVSNMGAHFAPPPPTVVPVREEAKSAHNNMSHKQKSGPHNMWNLV